MTSFVRNRLINEVYLPLIGNNLAKQLGAAGAILDGLQRGARLFQRGLVALLVRHLGQHHPVFEVLLHRLDGVDLAFQLRAFAADGLGLVGLVPQCRILDPRVQLIELS